VKCYGDLKEIFETLILSIKQQTRMLGSYYRVGFYGSLFNELDGKEFVYKEPKITRLVEIKDRLQAVYEEEFGAGKVQVLETSGAIDRSKLDPNIAYIQITSVVPYLDATEREARKTWFARLHNLNRFMFETPFMLSGPGQSPNVAEQYKRKTILTVERHFPYTRKRLRVTGKQEFNLTPIENSIETIEQRADVLLAEVRANPPNPKTLQAVLQGSVRLQVNAGPQEICRVFLAEEGASSFPAEHIARLRAVLRQFINTCSDALQVNGQFVESEQQRSFHEEMVQGCTELRARIELYLGADENTHSNSGSDLELTIQDGAELNI